ncbi:hypothetical protein [Nitrosophilus kaiyonis]|uniref:hypothetical protein n=1 Tax=Nitrosophilus kaiyonis TaxID=2930200 RepID=UPI0024933F41|nr:hypothetical protein [Nitrosophilus kaiyonis]
MNPHMFEKETLKNINLYSKKVGISLALLGSLAILANVIFPNIKIDIFIGLFLFFTGILIAFILYKNYYENRLSILHPLIPLISGLVFLTLPLKHDLAILITIVFYLFLDGFIKSAIGISYKPLKKYRYIIYSGAFSILLAMFIVFGWPLTNYWLLKLIVGANIFFDGIMFFNFSYGIEDELKQLQT